MAMNELTLAELEAESLVERDVTGRGGLQAGRGVQRIDGGQPVAQQRGGHPGAARVGGGAQQ